VFPAEGGFLMEAIRPSGEASTTELTRYALDGGILWRRAWPDDAYFNIMACVFDGERLYAAGNAKASDADRLAALVLCLNGETGETEWEQCRPAKGDVVLRHIALTDEGIAVLGDLYTDGNREQLLLQGYSPQGALISQQEIGFEADEAAVFSRSLLQVQGENIKVWGVCSLADSPVDYVCQASALFAVPEGYSPLGLSESASGDVVLYGLMQETASGSFLLRVPLQEGF
jgi:hypothetical protein